MKYEIEAERYQVALTGILIGLIISYWYDGNYCDWGLITVISTYLIYLIIPKKTILTSLKDQKQIEIWWEGYRHMQVRFYLGIAFATIGILFRTLT